MNDTNKLIKTEIKGRQVTYFLTTEDDLNNVKSNSLLGDIFAVLTSLAIGGIISVKLTMATGIELEVQTLAVLDLILWVFIVASIIFGLFTYHFYAKSFGTIKRIKKSGTVESLNNVDNQEETDSATEEKSQLKIVSATYFTNRESLDVTKEIRSKIMDNKLETIASNDIKHDPDPGTPKKLNVKYNFNGVTVTKQFKEGEKVLIP